MLHTQTKEWEYKARILFSRPSSLLSPLFLFFLPRSSCRLKHVVSCCASMWSDDQRQSGVVIVSRWSAAQALDQGPSRWGDSHENAREAGGTREALPGRNKDFLRAPLWQQSRLGRVKNEASTYFCSRGGEGATMGGWGIKWTHKNKRL